MEHKPRTLKPNIEIRKALEHDIVLKSIDHRKSDLSIAKKLQLAVASTITST